MKFNCGLSAKEKRDNAEVLRKLRYATLSDWHPFFAIIPRQVASNDCRWMETIERKGTYYVMERGHAGTCGIWSWEYRAKKGFDYRILE